jgi:hypothetical protein
MKPTNLWDNDHVKYVKDIIVDFNNKAKKTDKETKKQCMKRLAIDYLNREMNKIKFSDYDTIVSFENNILFYESAINKIIKN